MLRDVIENGNVNEVLTIIDRLQQFLPEYGKTQTDEKFAEHWKAVLELEEQLARRRALMRETAARIIDSVERNWSPEEIKRACGYPL